MDEPISTDFSLDDLMADGPDGEALRRAVVEGIAAGAVDALLAVQVANICCQRGRSATAVPFVVAALRAPLPEASGWGGVVRRVVSAAILEGHEGKDPDAAADALAKMSRALDDAHPETRYAAMTAVINALADHPRAGAAIAARLWGRRGLATSESFLVIHLAAHMFVGDLAAAGRAGHLLARRPRLHRWALTALTKLILAEGDYRRVEDMSRAVIARDGSTMSVLIDLVVALFCQGRQDEGHQVMALSAAILESTERVRERRSQIEQWSEQFAAALAERTVDGGEITRLGASIYYTHPEQVRAFYDAHREDATVANTYRTAGAYTNTVMFGEVEAQLAANPQIRKVINYGTLCGIREYELSERYPGVTWAGFDISELATEWNREAYVRDNLVFESDFDKLLADLAEIPGETLLVHCRTADIMLPEALARVYRACRAGGVGRIMTAEYFCRCVSTLMYPDFANNPVDAVHWDGILMAHNYAKIFPEIGYRVTGTAYRPIPLLVSANGEGLSGDQLIELVWAEAETS